MLDRLVRTNPGILSWFQRIDKVRGECVRRGACVRETNQTAYDPRWSAVAGGGIADAKDPIHPLVEAYERDRRSLQTRNS